MYRITPSLYGFSGLLLGRVYAIIDSDWVTLIDAGLTMGVTRILDQLRKAGYGPLDVTRILITHAHMDHVGGLQLLQQATGAEVIASALEKPVIEGRVPVATPNRSSLPFPARLTVPPRQSFRAMSVDRVVTDGEMIDEVMGGLQVIATPGHAPGHLAFWQPEQRILFVGDVVMKFTHLRLPFAGATVDMDANRRSLAKVAALEPTIVCFGHGAPLTKNAAGQLAAFAAKVAR